MQKSARIFDKIIYSPYLCSMKKLIKSFKTEILVSLSTFVMMLLLLLLGIDIPLSILLAPIYIPIGILLVVSGLVYLIGTKAPKK